MHKSISSSSSLPLHWGLLSTARINRALIPPLRKSPRNQLFAVASRSLGKAQEYALEWGVPHAFGSYEEMLANPEIDVIYNSLPNSLHAEWTIKAAKAGKHVLCEKPLALSVKDVDAMAEAASEAGVIIAEAFMFRHHPQTLKIKELVAGDAIGDVWLASGSFTFNITDESDVRLNPGLGGGSVWDVGCYPISYARFIIGSEPEAVFGWQVTGRQGVDESFAGQLRFSESVFAQFDSSFRSPVRMQFEIIGSRGSIMIPNPYKPGLNDEILIKRGNDTQSITVQGEDLYLGEVEDLADAILMGKPPRISLADSRANIATIQALLKSANEGTPVLL